MARSARSLVVAAAVIAAVAGGAVAGPSVVLVTVAEVDGDVLDVDATRVLYVDLAGTVRVRDRGDDSEAIVGPVQGARFGRLTSTGAYYASTDGAPGCPGGEALREWHGSGASIEVDRACAPVAVRWQFRGDWATRRDTPLRYVRRDLIAGVESIVYFPLVVSNHGMTSVAASAVAPDGALHVALYQPDSQGHWRFVRDDDGVQTTLPIDGTAFGSLPAIATDGVGYAVRYCQVLGGMWCSTVRCLTTSGACATAGHVEWPLAGDGVEMVGGWTFIRYHHGGGLAGPVTAAVARLSPAGIAEDVGGVDDALEAWSTSGALTLLRPTERVLVDASGTRHPLGMRVGRATFLGGDAHVLIGGTVFRVEPAMAAQAAKAAAAPESSGCASHDAGAGAVPLMLALLAWRRRRAIAIGFAACLALGCDGPAAAVDAGTDAAAIIDAAIIDAAIVDAAIVDAAIVDAAIIDAVIIDAAIDAPIIDASADAAIGSTCSVDTAFDVAATAQLARDLAVVEVGGSLLFIYRVGPPAASAPLWWTIVSSTGQPLIAPTQLAPQASPPQLAVNGARALAVFATEPGAGLMQSFDRSGLVGPARPIVPEPFVDVIAGLSDGFRAIRFTPSAWLSVSHLGAGLSIITQVAFTSIPVAAAHAAGSIAMLADEPHPLPGCPTCTSMALVTMPWSGGIETTLRPALAADTVATGRSITHLGTTYVAWTTAVASGPPVAATIARYPLDEVATLPAAHAITLAATGNGVGVVAYQDGDGAWLRRFTDDNSGFQLHARCALDVVPDRVVRVDADTVLVVDDAGHARLITP